MTKNALTYAKWISTWPHFGRLEGVAAETRSRAQWTMDPEFVLPCWRRAAAASLDPELIWGRLEWVVSEDENLACLPWHVLYVNNNEVSCDMDADWCFIFEML